MRVSHDGESALAACQSRARPAILPVRVDATPIADVPPALRAFTLLEPQGDVPAEIAASADRRAQTDPLRTAAPRCGPL